MIKACGTIYTAAPEILLSSGHSLTQQTDIWSIGVCAFILLSKEYPFLRDRQDLDDPAKRDDLANAKYTFTETWDKLRVTEQARFFVQQCLKKEPFHRWDAIDALDYIQNQWIPHLETTLDSSDKNDITELEADADCPMTPTKADRPESSVLSQPLKHSVSSIRKRARISSNMVKGMTSFALYGE
eukprot:7731549-Ditylum_brightwellii.AAC.1